MNQATMIATPSIATAITPARQGRGVPARRPPPITRSGIGAVVPDDDTPCKVPATSSDKSALTHREVVASFVSSRPFGDVRIQSIDRARDERGAAVDRG